jgi:multicomponent Na+:H+ antiporter subunit G
MELLALIGAIIAVIGSLFLFLASLGLVRMPDVYSRMQAGTKATTLGTMMVVLGLVFVVPADWTKLLLLGVFVMLTNPISSHALSRSAHYQGVDPLDIEVKGRELHGADQLREWKNDQGIAEPVRDGGAQ